MHRVKIVCKTKDRLVFSTMEEFQGDLKTHSVEQVEHIVKSIISHGFTCPIFIWKNGVHNCILDGHGRFFALQTLKHRGWEIPAVPVVYIAAESVEVAKRKLLAVNSVYGDFVESVLADFVSDLELPLEEYKFPNVDMEAITNRLMSEVSDSKNGGSVSVKILNAECPDCGYKFEVDVDE